MTSATENELLKQLRDAINELQKKQPYCYEPDKPLDTLKTIGRYIGELESTVLRMYREHPIAQFEQWIEDLGLNEADAWNPRTLEDTLIEYRLKAYNLYADQELTGDERVDEFKKLDAEYDSEIRDLMGGEGESDET